MWSRDETLRYRASRPPGLQEGPRASCPQDLPGYSLRPACTRLGLCDQRDTAKGTSGYRGDLHFSLAFFLSDCNRARAGAQPLARGAQRSAVIARPLSRECRVSLQQQSAWQWSSWQRLQSDANRGLLPGVLPGPPTLGHAGELEGPGDRLRGCVLQSSRALATAAHWPGPGLEAAANPSPILSSATSWRRPSPWVAVRRGLSSWSIWTLPLR